jgi:hypothetical protein
LYLISQPHGILADFFRYCAYKDVKPVNKHIGQFEEEFSMSKTNASMIRVLALFGLIATLGPLTAMAQAPYHFAIPFDFMVGSKSFTAGDYRVSEPVTGVINVRGDDGHSMLVVAWADVHGKSKTDAVLTFHRYGSQYFLSSVSDPDRGWKLPTPAAEKELIAGKASPKPLQIIASGK